MPGIPPTGSDAGILLSPDTLALLAGVLLSLALSYIPGVSAWFATLTPTAKRLTLLVAIVIVAGGGYALSCYGLFAGVTCDSSGATGLVRAVILALVASQGAYALTPERNEPE
jgi:hypothetical protein